MARTWSRRREAFDFRGASQRVEIDLTDAHIWDGSAVAAIDRVVLKLRDRGADVTLTGTNDISATLLDRVAIHDKAGAALPVGH